MKSNRRFSLLKVLVLAVGAMGASAIPAHAQAAAGRFTLAHKVRWGRVSLPAGDYTFSLESQTWPARITVRQLGGSTAAMILPTLISANTLTGASLLVLHDEGGESVVSALRLSSLGLALEFASPKLAMPVAETAGLAPLADPRASK
jgi:hypothetical protein